jgi:hypothetical protein
MRNFAEESPLYGEEAKDVLRLLDEVASRRREAQGVETRQEWRVGRSTELQFPVRLNLTHAREDLEYARQYLSNVWIESRTVTVGPWRRVEKG